MLQFFSFSSYLHSAVFQFTAQIRNKSSNYLYVLLCINSENSAYKHRFFTLYPPFSYFLAFNVLIITYLEYFSNHIFSFRINDISSCYLLYIAQKYDFQIPNTSFSKKGTVFIQYVSDCLVRRG